MIQSSFDTLEQWMLAFNAPLAMPQISQEEKKESHIIFIIKKKEVNNLPFFEFDFFKAKKLKYNQYGLLSPLSLKNIDREKDIEVSKKDLNLLQLIEFYKGELYKKDSPTLHNFQSFLFKELLSTGRLCWQNLFPMKITPTSPQPLIFSWQTLKNNDKKLVMKINGISKNWCLAPGSELYYIDLERYLAGPIETTLSKETFEKVKALPEIAEKKIPGFCRFIKTHKIFDAIPLPEGIGQKIIKAKPIPYLSIRLAMIDKEPVALAQLQFIYETYKLPPLKILEESKSKIFSFEEKNLLVDIHRDISEEKNIESILKSYSFEHFLADKNSSSFILKTSGITLFEKENSFYSIWEKFEQDSIPQLQSMNWQVIINKKNDLIFHTQSKLNIEIENKEDGLYSMNIDLLIGGQKIPFAEQIGKWLSNIDQITSQDYLIEFLDDQTRIKIPTKDIVPFLFFWKDLKNSNQNKKEFSLSFENLGFLQHAVFSKFQTDPFQLEWNITDRLERDLRQFIDFKKEEGVLPDTFIGELRDYQKQGLNWLQKTHQATFNGILADDMGLGKTIQALAHLASEKEKNNLKNPALIVVPTSLMFNWKKEAYKFTPTLNICLLHGRDRSVLFNNTGAFDLIITTYSLLKRDSDFHLAQHYSFFILDEAQYIKNFRSQNASLVKLIQADHRLCLTGTPVENHLGELWSMFDFLMPGFLGSINEFNRYYRTPIEKENNEAKRSYLVQKISPFLLRRTKEEVAPELPAKTEFIQYIEMEEAQKSLYEAFRFKMENRVKDLFFNQGFSKSRFFILDALLKLRQICCHPKLLSKEIFHDVNESAKLLWLTETIPIFIEEGRRILIFSQFVQMLNLIEEKIIELGVPYSKLTGQTKNREHEIENFQEDKTYVFLISLKAGGVGLNLTNADTVIHFDPWWNPAVENQATDRAHRIGQTKPIFVYKLVAESTIEEKILKLQEKKKHIADAIFSTQKNSIAPLSEEELLHLFT